MTISELMIRLQKAGNKSTSFFFNAGIGEWQFTACNADRQYSYGYGKTPEAAALDALTNIENGKPVTKMRLEPKKEDIEDFL